MSIVLALKWGVSLCDAVYDWICIWICRYTHSAACYKFTQQAQRNDAELCRKAS